MVESEQIQKPAGGVVQKDKWASRNEPRLKADSLFLHFLRFTVSANIYLYISD